MQNRARVLRFGVEFERENDVGDEVGDLLLPGIVFNRVVMEELHAEGRVEVVEREVSGISVDEWVGGAIARRTFWKVTNPAMLLDGGAAPLVEPAVRAAPAAPDARPHL